MKIESWSDKIEEIGAIYPFGGETIMVMIAFVLWVAWFVIQGRMENREYQEEIVQLSSKDKGTDK